MYRYIFTTILLFISPFLFAQKICCESCYEEGQRFFKAKKYDAAELLFKRGMDCPKKCTYDFQKLIEEVKKARIANPVTAKKDTIPLVVTPFKEPEMVFVKGGTFKMGNEGFDEEKPVHSVMLNDFYIGKFEITQLEWRGIMASDPPHLSFDACDQCPVERVSWLDVQEFLKKLNAKTGKKYRLPTEAEWEYAARGGANSKNFKYSGSDEINDVAWYGNNSGGKTHPGGSKKPNELGIYDMSGNVWEWCQDWFDRGYYKYSPAKNPKGAFGGTARILRGGSWINFAKVSRVTFRDINPPNHINNTIGFRVVL